MSKKLFDKYFKANLNVTSIVLQGFGNSRIVPLVTVNFTCANQTKKCVLEFVVVDTETETLISCDGCCKLGFLSVVNELGFTHSIIEKYKDNFRGLGKFRNKYKIILKKDCVPVVRPPRRVPLGIKDKLKAKLDWLEKELIIGSRA